MKRLLPAFLCLCLTLSLAACQKGADPAQVSTVGSIGNTSFSGELYQLLRLNAVQANPQDSEEDLRQAVLRAMEEYAAVEESFSQLGGEMGSEGEDYVAQYTQSIWEKSESTMSANGISKDTLEDYVEHLYRADQMLSLYYGENGVRALSDQDILDYVGDSFYYGTCVYIPLTGEENADIRQDQAAMDTAHEAANRIQQAIAAGSSPQAAAQQELPRALALTGASLDTQDVSSYVYTNMYTPFNWESSLSQASIEALQNMNIGDCIVLENSTDLTVFLRADPSTDYTPAEMRSYVTFYMKNDELKAELAQAGTQLEHNLDQATIDSIWARSITY